MPDRQGKIAAQVVIAGPSMEGVTARDVRERLPPAATGEDAARGFAELGFHTGPVVGNSFSIEATASVFNKVFGVSLVASHAGVLDEDKGKAQLDSLPVSKLPKHLRALVSDVVFSKPPEFGPGAP